jgi:hypothetical protein
MFFFQEFLSEQCDEDLFCVDDVSNHFLLSFDRIMEDEYSPTATDILTARIPTTGEKKIFKLDFQIFCMLVSLSVSRHLINVIWRIS